LHDAASGMNAKYLNSPAGSRRTARLSLDVVLAYEDFAAGMHGLRTFDGLFLDGEPGNPGGKRSIWKFNLLEVASLAKAAVTDAATADMIIIAAHGPGELAPAAKRWVQAWMRARKTGPGALVLLLDGAGVDDSINLPVEDYLKACAGRAGMQFFVQKLCGRHAFDDYQAKPHSGRIRNLFAEVRQIMQAAIKDADGFTTT
jgi:hypothetical protein